MSAAASFGSPSKCDTSSTWVACLRRKRRTNNELIDMKAETDFEMLKAMLTTFDKHPDDIAHVFAHSRRLERKHEADEKAHVDKGATFTNFGTLKNLDEPKVIALVVEHTGMTKADILKAKEYDHDAAYHILSYLLQLPLKYRLEPSLRNVGFFNKFANRRMADVGAQGKTLKEKGCLLPSGKLDWNGTRFTLSWDEDDLLEKLTHVKTGFEAKLPRGHNITKANYEFDSMHCDDEAYCVLEPFAPMLLHTFFNDKGDNPFNYVRASNKKKSNKLVEQIEELEKAFILEVELQTGAGSSSTAVVVEIETELAAQASAKAKALMTKARAKALAQGSEMKKKRRMSK